MSSASKSMSDLVTALERRGLISRQRDPDNRRRMVISLTDAARKRLAEYDEPARAREQQMVSALTATQRATPRSSLNACRAALSDQPPHRGSGATPWRRPRSRPLPTRRGGYRVMTTFNASC
jgi:hypothetical protein